VNLPDDYDKVKYSLCSIAFDPASGTFGSKVDTLVSAYKTGKSISFPRTSYDGKYLMFTMSDYGNFSIWHKEADLWLMNLANGTIKPLTGVNSDNTESYHSWSSGSHWFVFSSRRIDGLHTRPYIAWLDDNGMTTKPFILPQKDPDFYDDFMSSFNIPELVKDKVKSNGRNMLKAIGSAAKNVTFESKD
jgi:dipeptidyl aminopeptidase/acylaminoacyl peptidase